MSSPTNYDAYKEKLICQGEEVLKAFIPKMVLIWEQLGFPLTKIEEKIHAVLFHHQELWESMLEVERANKKKILGTVDRLGRQYYYLCKELSITVRDFGEHTPLLEMEKLLNDAISLLNAEKDERMKAVRVLFKEEDQLCRRLCMDISPTNRDKIPTSVQFQFLQERITNLKAEVAQRQSQYVTMRDSIRGAMLQLEMSARTSFEMGLFVNEPSSVNLSDKEMITLEEWRSNLISRLEHNQRKAQQLRNVIESLWERLNIEQDVRDVFLMENRGHAPSTIKSLERERDLLNVLKEKRLKKSINAARQNLIFWWNRCYVSEGERRRFTLFNTEIFSEELLELHEAQVEKLKKLHAQYKDIFLKIDHRENLWRRMEDIERKSKNPVRLFGNRGCALLQEEKERTKIVKELPRVEKQLFEMLTNHERERGQIFLIDGVDYRTTVRNQWSNHEACKENDKKECAENLVKEAKGGAKPSTSTKRRLAGTTGMRTQLEPPKTKQLKLVLAPSTAPQQRTTHRKPLTDDRLNNLPNNFQKKAGDKNSAPVVMDIGKAVAASCATPTRTSHRRSLRLASRTDSVTPLSAAHKDHCMMLRRSKTEVIEPVPPHRSSSSLSRPLTPALSTPKLTLAIHPHPFLV